MAYHKTYSLFFILFLFLGCSHFKKQSSSKRDHLAPKSSESFFLKESANLKVSRIEIKASEKKVFASGFDSVFLFVRVFDENGKLMTHLDPNDFNLSATEDVEAKPFIKKNGTYRAEILPRVKSKSLILRVDWRQRILGPKLVLETTLLPLKNKLTPLMHEFYQSHPFGDISVVRGNLTDHRKSEGFVIENDSQVFHFDYPERARQNLSLILEDAASEALMRQSLMMFFPRKQLPTVEHLSGVLRVTLPTGELVVFSRETKKLVEGVLKPEKKTLEMSFPVTYTGKGVILTWDSFINKKFEELTDNNEVYPQDHVNIIHYQTKQKCRRPRSDFWNPIEVSPKEFIFSDDKDFDEYLKKNCGFSLPKI